MFDPHAPSSANHDGANVFHAGVEKTDDSDGRSEAGSRFFLDKLFGIYEPVDIPQHSSSNADLGLPGEVPFSGLLPASYSLSNEIGYPGDFPYVNFPNSATLVALTDPFSPSEWSTGLSDVYGRTFSLGSFENFSESSLEPASLGDGKAFAKGKGSSKLESFYPNCGPIANNHPSGSLTAHPNLALDEDIETGALALSPEDKVFWGWFLANSHDSLETSRGPTSVNETDQTSSTEGSQPDEPDSNQKVFSLPKTAPGVPKRFVSTGPVDVMVSAIQCLSVVLDYRGYQGEIQRIVVNNNITNFAYTKHDAQQQRKLYSLPISELYVAGCNMEFVGFPGSDSAPSISIVSGILQRKIYIRDISAVANAVSLILYVELPKFNINLPYEPQIHRFELDNRGSVVNETKCGLCPFCPTIKFLPFKNSSYLSHLTLEHGVYANSFVVPEGLYYGKYSITRNVDVHKTRTVRAIQCPACFQVVEVSCWKNKANPLLSYFRHFKKKHQNLTKTFMRSNVDPMLYDKQ